jgi:hypothetical protein
MCGYALALAKEIVRNIATHNQYSDTDSTPTTPGLARPRPTMAGGLQWGTGE